MPNDSKHEVRIGSLEGRMTKIGEKVDGHSKAIGKLFTRLEALESEILPSEDETSLSLGEPKTAIEKLEISIDNLRMQFKNHQRKLDVLINGEDTERERELYELLREMYLTEATSSSLRVISILRVFSTKLAAILEIDNEQDLIEKLDKRE